jgi:ssDNA-binding Zn-finger/Zn-ribbon topoisomerase 1
MTTSIQTYPEPYCPECGGRMRLIRPRPGNRVKRAFWGCCDWPDCSGRRQIGPDGKPESDEFVPGDFDYD